MISAHAKESLDTLVVEALATALAGDGQAPVQVEVLPAGSWHPVAEQPALAQLLGSFSFRMLTVVHPEPAAALCDSRLAWCCQQIGAALQGHFAGLGIARPQWQATCLHSLTRRLQPTHAVQYRVVRAGQVLLHASAFINAYLPLHFSATPPVRAAA